MSLSGSAHRLDWEKVSLWKFALVSIRKQGGEKSSLLQLLCFKSQRVSPRSSPPDLLADCTGSAIVLQQGQDLASYLVYQATESHVEALHQAARHLRWGFKSASAGGGVSQLLCLQVSEPYQKLSTKLLAICTGASILPRVSEYSQLTPSFSPPAISCLLTFILLISRAIRHDDDHVRSR